MQISIIVAMAENRVIGRNNQLPWHMPADLQYFKATTLGKPIIMGRKTYVSIGKPLPGRTNIVLSQDPDFQASGCVVVANLEAAITAAGTAPEVMIIGGSTLFVLALPQASRVYLTLIHALVDGDTYFPMLEPSQWREVSRQDHAADAKNTFPYSFIVLERI